MSSRSSPGPSKAPAAPRLQLSAAPHRRPCSATPPAPLRTTTVRSSAGRLAVVRPGNRSRHTSEPPATFPTATKGAS